ncbi:hypothetical protein FQR65_LT16496 [Abscondita terminalis]|nr:hypothetical protein FQR65_LT16496 [Abscondita terminalis]
MTAMCIIQSENVTYEHQLPTIRDAHIGDNVVAKENQYAEFKKCLGQKKSLFVSKLYSNYSFPRNIVQNVLEDISELLKKPTEILKAKLATTTSIDSNVLNEETVEMLDAFSVFFQIIMAKTNKFVWSKEVIQDLCILYENKPILYRTHLPDYKDKNKRLKALNEIRNQLNERHQFVAAQCLTTEIVKTKIHGLRTQFFKEYNLLKSSKSSGCSTTDIKEPEL